MMKKVDLRVHLINSPAKGKALASRCLCQRDLSTFLFIIIVNCFNRIVTCAPNRNLSKGFDLGENSMEIHNLEFFDNTITFSTKYEQLYLGFPLNSKHHFCSFWDPLIRKVDKRL